MHELGQPSSAVPPQVWFKSSVPCEGWVTITSDAQLIVDGVPGQAALQPAVGQSRSLARTPIRIESFGGHGSTSQIGLGVSSTAIGGQYTVMFTVAVSQQPALS